jgi:short-subunit dehydrogenase involved in D-alanine esterification of teichoic acids
MVLAGASGSWLQEVRMEFTANTVLITGGASVIGFSLAQRFIQAGSIEAAYGFSVESSRSTREQLAAIFK